MQLVELVSALDCTEAALRTGFCHYCIGSLGRCYQLVFAYILILAVMLLYVTLCYITLRYSNQSLYFCYFCVAKKESNLPGMGIAFSH